MATPGIDTVAIGYAIAAIGALGTAAYGLVDVLKFGRDGGPSNAGYSFIEAAVAQFFPGETRAKASGSLKRLFDALHGNWINGRPLADQKAIAKSPIKLRLDGSTAKRFAGLTDVKPAVLEVVGAKMAAGEKLTDEEMNALGRFDLGLTEILDDAYQHADQCYRNYAKQCAMRIAVLLALAGCVVSFPPQPSLEYLALLGKALLAGLIATPLAPIAKDLASAVQAGAKVAQLMRK
jgi:hypothetical protein